MSNTDDVFLSARQVRNRFGGISDMALHRWLHDDRIGFPKPIVIGTRRFWKLEDLQAFEKRCVSRKTNISPKHVSRRKLAEVSST